MNQHNGRAFLGLLFKPESSSKKSNRISFASTKSKTTQQNQGASPRIFRTNQLRYDLHGKPPKDLEPLALLWQTIQRPRASSAFVTFKDLESLALLWYSKTSGLYHFCGIQRPRASSAFVANFKSPRASSAFVAITLFLHFHFHIVFFRLKFNKTKNFSKSSVPNSLLRREYVCINQSTISTFPRFRGSVGHGNL